MAADVAEFDRKLDSEFAGSASNLFRAHLTDQRKEIANLARVESWESYVRPLAKRRPLSKNLG